MNENSFYTIHPKFFYEKALPYIGLDFERDIRHFLAHEKNDFEQSSRFAKLFSDYPSIKEYIDELIPLIINYEAAKLNDHGIEKAKNDLLSKMQESFHRMTNPCLISLIKKYGQRLTCTVDQELKECSVFITYQSS